MKLESPFLRGENKMSVSDVQRIICTALDQAEAEGLSIEICSLYKLVDDGMTFKVKLCNRQEEMRRSLTLKVHKSLEVNFPGLAFFEQCLMRVNHEIRAFWEATNEQTHWTAEIY
jgi:hypothetical protein